MSRDDASLFDIFKAGQRALNFAQGLSRSNLEIEEMRVPAILYQIQIMGEVTKRLSQEFREQYPQIPWSRTAGMRDIIAHDYDRIDLDVAWNVIQQSIPELLAMLAPLLPQEPAE